MATATIVPPSLARPEASGPHEPSSLIEEPLYEVVNGKRVELPPLAISSIRVANTLGFFMESCARAERAGRVTVEMLHWLDEAAELKRRPDISYVSYERWPRNKAVTDDEAWDVVPDLAVEVVSPSVKADGLLEKVEEYFVAGVRLVWVVYPRRRVVHMFESFTQIKVTAEGQELDGGSILRGFRVPLVSLFEDLGAKEQNGA
jgi:Uma2 family endonuclease